MKINLFLITAIVMFSGCIKNDIPFPADKGLITEIEFSGQETVEIDNANNVVNVVLKDTTDILNVKLLKFATSEKTTVKPEVKVPMIMNLSADYSLLLTTYRDYQWTIKTTQPINRAANVNRQVGKAVFDEVKHTVLIQVAPGTDKSNIMVNSIVFASEENSTVSPSPESIHDFSSPVVFTVTQHRRTVEWTVRVEEADYAVLTLEPEEIWAKRAILKGEYLIDEESMEVVIFEYRLKEENLYKQSGNVVLNNGLASFTLITEPSTTYSYRIRQGAYIGKDVSFTTEATPTVPNLSFEDWCEIKKESSDKKVWYPCLESEWGKKENYRGYWNTGNDGVVVAGKTSNAYPVTENGKTVACLETVGDVAFVGLAAGNLFTGNFITVVTDPLKSTKFGRPFTGRPTKLTGKYKYFPKNIDIVSKNHPEFEKYRGESDRCIMWINLEDWKGATTRPEDPTVIARAEYREIGTVSDYRNFELVLDYKDRFTQPTHICIVFSASEFGDFFTGGAGTKLFIDDLQLIY